MPLVLLGIRVPEAHAEAIKAYAARLTRETRLRVTPSAAGAAVIEHGLIALGLLEAHAEDDDAPAPPPARKPTSKRAAPAAKKGAKRKARKP